MGTVKSITSRSLIAAASTMHAAIACSTVDRWLYSTPLGSPVVPEV